MKTPKRYPATMSVYATREELRQDRARWKRKNRTAQLKRSLHRYKEGTMLPELRDIRLAYKWIQELKKPKQYSELECWHTYLFELNCIQRAISRAIVDAAIGLGKSLEYKNKKEQPHD